MTTEHFEFADTNDENALPIAGARRLVERLKQLPAEFAASPKLPAEYRDRVLQAAREQVGPMIAELEELIARADELEGDDDAQA